MRLARLLVALCIAFCATSVARAETAGQVMFAYGEAHALRAGRIVHLMAGSRVEPGDQLHTGVDSYLQVRFTDWGVMSLRPRTDFVIDEYAYEARTGGFERAFFSLLNGGVRSLTGLIGHRDRSHYRLRTRTTAIGIRGTHYSVLICQQDCRQADGSLGEDGLYGGVIDGRIAVSPYGGPQLEREFAAGQYFRLESERSIPVPLFTPPSFFWDKLEPQARAGGRTFAGIPWKPAPDPVRAVAGGDLGVGPLLRTDGSLTLSSITAPVLSQIGALAGSTVAGLAAPVTPLVGSTVGPLAGLVVNPALAPVTSTVGSMVGSVANPVLAPVAPVVGSTLGTVVNPVIAPVAPAIGATVTPVVAPVAPVIAPVAPVVAPVIAPVVAPVIAPIAPVIAPIAPVIAPVAPVIAPVVPIAPVIAPPTSTVSLPTVPTLPVVGGSLLPRK